MNLNDVIAERRGKKVYRDGNRAIKLFDTEYSKPDILKEALNQSRIEMLALNVPKIQEVTVIDGKWAIVMDYIKGKTLTQLMQEQPERLDEYLNMFVEIQMHIHTQRSALLTKIKDKMNDKITNADLDSNLKYDLHTRLESMPNHSCVCHGDFNPSNVIYDEENNKSYIIDWSHVTQGNPSADVARTYLIFNLAGHKEIGDKYLELFCQKSDIDKKHIQDWIPIVAASQLVKRNEEERKFLLKWIDVVDYA